MTSQEQCNRMKAVCLENGLPIGNFKYSIFTAEVYFSCISDYFEIGWKYDKYEVTESEFLELLKEYKLNK